MTNVVDLTQELIGYNAVCCLRCGKKPRVFGSGDLGKLGNGLFSIVCCHGTNSYTSIESAIEAWNQMNPAPVIAEAQHTAEQPEQLEPLSARLRRLADEAEERGL
ncbi:MAG TPA: hypothetical protein VNL17_14525 [Verrucomicrobiae bacterium]|nr:hypothetical protein [Verrucomicrobiae bacterium]